MFVQSSIEVPFNLDAVQAEMLASVHLWLQPLLEEAILEARVLRADLIPSQATADRGALNVTIGSPSVGELMASIPYRVWRDGGSMAFDSHLTAGWFGDRHSQLKLDAHYYLPDTQQPRDRQLLHRMAEVMSRRFLEKVALELIERLSAVGD
jgi:hypothetical protein